MPSPCRVCGARSARRAWACASRGCAPWPKRSVHWGPSPRAALPRIWPSACTPEGFSAADLAERVETQQGRAMVGYGDRKASYDLRKMRGKSLVERVGKTRRYWVRRPGIRTLAALLILREQVIKPVLAGVC